MEYAVTIQASVVVTAFSEQEAIDYAKSDLSLSEYELDRILCVEEIEE